MQNTVYKPNYGGIEGVTGMQITRRTGRTYTCLVDSEDVQKIKDFAINWSLLNDDNHYFRTTKYEDGRYKTYLLHRLIMDAPTDMVVDHLSGDTLDCRKENMRLTTPLGNAQNMSTTDGYRGVTKCGTGYKAQITCDGIHTVIGYYATEVEACRAYNIASRSLRGDVHTCNDVEDPYGEVNTPQKIRPISGRARLTCPSYYLYEQAGKKRTTYRVAVRDTNKITHTLGTYATKEEAEKAIHFHKIYAN
ncbi:hypothetical protein KDA08_04400 [Candidatus Saccharibacteria bacterium]|nr:hypothetical protein [Candidatus Saccharibacteria bacterium]